ncbi:MAG: hypothetical protein JSS11_02545 [Verrucomicrobia bacterium]|nr:hypothetical protein [Verrucomicrobiota bacterium]
MNAARRHWLAVAILTLCTATTGVSFVLTKASIEAQLALVPGESTWFVSAQNMVPRFATGLVLLVALHGWGVLRLTAAEWRQAVFLALTSTCGCLLQLDGMQFTGASVTAFLTQFYVILIPLWTALAHRRAPGLRLALAGLLVLAGVAVLANVDWRTFTMGRGEAEVLLAACFFSFVILGLSWEGCAKNRPGPTVAGMFALEGAIFLGLSVVLHHEAAHIMRPWASLVWLPLVVLAALLGTAGPFIVLSHWQKFVGAAEASLIYSFGPVFSALSGLFLPAWLSVICGISYANEQATSSLIIGGLLILSANALIQFWPSRPAD